MGEFARVFTDKRIIMVSLIILVLNGLMFFNSAKYDTSQERAGYLVFVDMLEIQNKEIQYERALQHVNDWNEKNAEYFNKAIANGQYEYNYEDYFSENEMKEYYANAIYVDKYQYVMAYGEHIDYVIQNSENMKKSDILYSEGSFSKDNIDKTQKDFEKIKKIKVSMGNDRWIEKLVNYEFVEYLVLILIVIAVIVILDERKKGLWETVYATKYGRSILALKRVVLLLSFSFVGVAMLAVENIVIAANLSDGIGDVFRSIQSVSLFKNVTLEANILQFVVLMYLWKVVSLSVIGMLFFILATSIKSYIVPIFLLFVTLFGEILLYKTLSATSVFGPLKNINIVSGLFSQDVMKSYGNVNVFGKAINSYNCMIVTAVVLFILLGVLLIVSGRRKPFLIGESISARVLSRISYKLKLYRHNSMLIHEMHKQLWIVRVLIVCIFMVLVSVMTMNLDEVKYGYSDYVYNQYMDLLEGKANLEKKMYLKNEVAKWQNKYDATYLELDNLMQEEGSIYQINALQKKMDQYMLSVEITKELEGLSDKLAKLKEEGYNAEFVNEIGYNNYLGEKSYDINQKTTMINMLFVVFAVSGIYAYENSQNSKLLTYPTKYGRTKFVIVKCASVFIITLFIYTVSSISVLYEINYKYGLSGIAADAQSLYLFEDLNFKCPIWVVIIVIHVMKLLLLYGMSLVVMFISSKSKNVVTAILVSSIIFMLPALLVYMGYEQLQTISVLDELMFTEKWR